MGGRDHSCETCGRGGFNDPDGRCVCTPDGQSDSEHIEFLDPDTGESYQVLAAKHTVDAAYKLGFIPATAEAMDRVDAVDGL